MAALKPSEVHAAAHVAMAEGGRFANFEKATHFVSYAADLGDKLQRCYERAASGIRDGAGEIDRTAMERNAGAIRLHEQRLRDAFKAAGLGLYLNGDCRGSAVGILTPKTGRYNTMGGAECGWRL